MDRAPALAGVAPVVAEAPELHPDEPTQQDTFRAVSRDRVGAYAEWLGFLESRWQPQLGVRADTVFADAGAVERFFPAAAADRVRINARDRQQDKLNLDVTDTLRHIPNRHRTYELGLARTNRAPGIVEWFLWTPLSTSAGQADGRSDLGNLGLELGLNNVFDADDTDHLGGINRVSDSAVAVGQRLPGIGRSL